MKLMKYISLTALSCILAFGGAGKLSASANDLITPDTRQITLLSEEPEADSQQTLSNLSITGRRHYDAAYQVLALVNQERAKEGLTPLTMDQDLLEAAMKRAAECSVDFSHTRPDQTQCFSAESKMTGENIAAGATSASLTMYMWMNSAGHRSNILKSTFQSIGVGCFEQGGTWFWVQTFGNDEATPVAQPQNCVVTESVTYVSDVYDSKFLLLSYRTDNTVYTGKTLAFQAIVLNRGFSDSPTLIDANTFTWSSSNPSVATVNEQGIATGLSAGDAVITASSANLSVSLAMHVKTPSTSNATGKVNASAIKLQIKQKIAAYKVIDIPNGDSAKSYQSSNPKVFTVTASGKITAKKAGSAKITVTLASGEKRIAKVVVQKGKVKTTKLTVNAKKLTLKAGQKSTLKVQRIPYTSQEKITYKSSKPKIAAVNKNGKITAKKKGTTKITITSGKKKIICTVTVK